MVHFSPAQLMIFVCTEEIRYISVCRDLINSRELCQKTEHPENGNFVQDLIRQSRLSKDYLLCTTSLQMGLTECYSVELSERNASNREGNGWPVSSHCRLPHSTITPVFWLHLYLSQKMALTVCEEKDFPSHKNTREIKENPKRTESFKIAQISVLNESKGSEALSGISTLSLIRLEQRC